MPRHSLKGRKTILSLITEGKKCGSSLLTINWNREIPDGGKGYRTVFVVPSAAGNAVERNRIRRWLREDFGRLQNGRKLDGAFAIRFKGRADSTDHKTLGGSLEKLYHKIEADE